MIAILVTGGTFDKQYSELNGTLAFRETHVPEMLRLGRCRVDVAVRQLMMIDSLEMTGADRGAIAGACLQSSESRIVITHGTDTMVETARTLAAAVPPARGKTIVLGSALSFAQALPPGVYLAMNGRAFSWDDVRKNRETGVFESL